MGKSRIRVLRNKYINAYHIKIVNEQRYFSQTKLYDYIFHQLLINVVLTC
jgi:hypothetical protein